MKLVALEISLDVIRSLRHTIAPLRRSDPRLYDQIRRASSSVALNLAEGRRRIGADRKHFWRTAAGSADEVQTEPAPAPAPAAVSSYEEPVEEPAAVPEQSESSEEDLLSE